MIIQREKAEFRPIWVKIESEGEIDSLAKALDYYLSHHSQETKYDFCIERLWVELTTKKG